MDKQKLAQLYDDGKISIQDFAAVAEGTLTVSEDGSYFEYTDTIVQERFDSWGEADGVDFARVNYIIDAESADIVSVYARMYGSDGTEEHPEQISDDPGEYVSFKEGIGFCEVYGKLDVQVSEWSYMSNLGERGVVITSTDHLSPRIKGTTLEPMIKEHLVGPSAQEKHELEKEVLFEKPDKDMVIADNDNDLEKNPDKKNPDNEQDNIEYSETDMDLENISDILPKSDDVSYDVSSDDISYNVSTDDDEQDITSETDIDLEDESEFNELIADIRQTIIDNKFRDILKEDSVDGGKEWHTTHPIPEIFDRLAGDEDINVRLVAATNEKYTKPETLDKLAGDKNVYVREAVAGNKNTNPKTLDRLADDVHWRVSRAVAENENANPTTLERLVDNKNLLSYEFDVSKAVAKNKNANSETLDKLADDKNPNVRKAIAENKNVNPTTLDRLAEDKNRGVREAVAKSVNANPITLDKLANDKDPNVRYAVSRNENTNPATLDKLSDDEDSNVRYGVTRNANTNPTTLDKLAEDKDSFVRYGVARSEHANPTTIEHLTKDEDMLVKNSAISTKETMSDITDDTKENIEMSQDDFSDIDETQEDDDNYGSDWLD